MAKPIKEPVKVPEKKPEKKPKLKAADIVRSLMAKAIRPEDLYPMDLIDEIAAQTKVWYEERGDVPRWETEVFLEAFGMEGTTSIPDDLVGLFEKRDISMQRIKGSQPPQLALYLIEAEEEVAAEEAVPEEEPEEVVQEGELEPEPEE